MFSYVPDGTARNDVRLLIGDTDDNAATDVRLEDEEIDRLLVLTTGTSTPGNSGTRRTAAEAADALAAKFARKAEGSVGPQRVAPTSRAQELRTTARLLRQGATAAAVPFAGGISVSSKQTAEDDTDRPSPAFRKGLLDNPDGA